MEGAIKPWRACAVRLMKLRTLVVGTWNVCTLVECSGDARVCMLWL